MAIPIFFVVAQRRSTSPHPVLSLIAGSWEAKNGVYTSALGPFSHTNGTVLSVTNMDNDGNIYLKHYSANIYGSDVEGVADQLMHVNVNNDKMQYCAGATAPFKLMRPGYSMSQKLLISAGEDHVYPLTKQTVLAANALIGNSN